MTPATQKLVEAIRSSRPHINIHMSVDALELKAKEAGKHCVWGVRPKQKMGQFDIPFMPMCAGFPGRGSILNRGK